MGTGSSFGFRGSHLACHATVGRFSYRMLHKRLTPADRDATVSRSSTQAFTTAAAGGLAPNWRPDCQQWYSPKQLQLLQPLFVPVPPPAAFLLGPPPAKSPASFGDPTDSQDSQLQQIPQTPTTPITRDDFIAWATEFGDNDTLERMRTDPTYCHWKQ